MTDFQKMYQDKLTTPERIAQQVQSGWLIGMDTATSQTPAIMAAMAQHIRSTDITGVKVQTLLDGYPFDFYPDAGRKDDGLQLVFQQCSAQGGQRRLCRHHPCVLP